MNTGAILNRINFGLALAAGRAAGRERSRTWPSTASTARVRRASSRWTAWSRRFLGGQSSPETRAILLSGENPLVATSWRRGLDTAAPDISDADDGDDGDAAAMRDGAAVAKNGRRAPRCARRRWTDRCSSTGLAQVVGLALGSPEFQRR